MRGIFLFFFFSIGLIALSQDTVTVEQLDYQLLVVGADGFEPMTSPIDHEVAGLFLNCDDNETIEICGDFPFSVWIGGQHHKESKAGCVFVKPSEVCQSTSGESLFLSVVSPNGLKGLTLRRIRVEPMIGEDFGELVVRNQSKDFWIIGFILILSLLVVSVFLLKNGGAVFQKKALKNFLGTIWEREQLLLLIISTVVIGFSFSFLKNEPEFRFFAQTTLAIFAIWGLKIALTITSAFIFNLVKMANWQLVAQVHFWSVISLILCLAQFLDFLIFNASTLSNNWAFTFLSVSSIVLFLVLTTFFLFQKGIKKLHIFIYLCTTEILPITVLVYWFLK